MLLALRAAVRVIAADWDSLYHWIQDSSAGGSFVDTLEDILTSLSFFVCELTVLLLRTLMSSSSTVTYTSVYSDSESWRFQWVSDDEMEVPNATLQSPRQAPPSPDYVPGPKHPPSQDYVPGHEELEQSSDDDDDDEEQEAPKEDEDEEGEHLALTNSTTFLAIDLVPSAEDT
ncbi:hypothetical protein Tco_0607647 [Tanacetum coccineum]